eukprot:1411101-Prymnesium_polylepis.1
MSFSLHIVHRIFDDTTSRKNEPGASKPGATQMTDGCVMRIRVARCQFYSCSSFSTNERRRT